MGIGLAIASPIIAVTKVTAANSYISQTANDAKSLAEKNARDFEYFKGEVTATMKAHKDGLDKMDRKFDKMEVKIDRVIEIMSGFQRADD